MKQTKIFLIAFVFAVAASAAVVCLYQLPAEAVIYMAVLWLGAGAAAFLYGYVRYRQKVQTLCLVEKAPEINLDRLGETTDEVELLYRDIIRKLDGMRMGAETERQRSLEEMTDYYTMWAHQIKTPIAGLQLLLQMERSELEEAELKDEIAEELYVKQLQNVTDIEEELFRIEEYVGMALQYQRVNSTENDYILKQISLDTVIREVIHKYAKIMIRRKILMQYEKTEVTVISDEKWLAFVLEQLLSNAVKYMSEGELIIEVREEPQHIWLEIRDTGIGIRSEDIPRVFEKGYTGFNGHEDKRSTGIGLYLCREVLQKLGYTIQIQSELGEGTTVKVGFSKDTIDFRD